MGNGSNRPDSNAVDPPTVGYLKGQGVLSLTAWCHNFECRHHATFLFSQLELDDDQIFIDLKHRFRCSKCGSREVAIQPDWPVWRPSDR